jgi:hypothetical protein
LFTYDEPQAIENVWSISAALTPSAFAFSRSMSTLNCGVSFRPFGRTCASVGSLAAMPSSMLRASISFSWPTPERSSSSKSKPAAVPSSGMDGGLIGMINASL